MELLDFFRKNVKVFFAQTLFRFEGIKLSNIDTRILLDQGIMKELNFEQDQTQIIMNVINGLNLLRDKFDSLYINEDTYKKLQSVLAFNQALVTGDFRTGDCYIGCIEEPIPPASSNLIKKNIFKLQNLTTQNMKKEIPKVFTSLARAQPFYDGNKRTTLFMCNVALLKKDLGVFFIPNNKYDEFESLLTDFYTEKNEKILSFLENCVFSKHEILSNEKRFSVEDSNPVLKR